VSAQEKRELRQAARDFTDDALNTLAEICKNGQSESASVAADLRGKGHQRTEGSEPYVSSALQDEAIQHRYDDLPLSRIVFPASSGGSESRPPPQSSSDGRDTGKAWHRIASSLGDGPQRPVRARFGQGSSARNQVTGTRSTELWWRHRASSSLRSATIAERCTSRRPTSFRN
jgi:hypothetical protein